MACAFQAITTQTITANPKLPPTQPLEKKLGESARASRKQFP